VQAATIFTSASTTFFRLRAVFLKTNISARRIWNLLRVQHRECCTRKETNIVARREIR
jgi:hypothetical protein